MKQLLTGVTLWPLAQRDKAQTLRKKTCTKLAKKDSQSPTSLKTSEQYPNRQHLNKLITYSKWFLSHLKNDQNFINWPNSSSRSKNEPALSLAQTLRHHC